MSIAGVLAVNVLIGAASVYEGYLIRAWWVVAAASVSTATMLALAVVDDHERVFRVAAVVYMFGVVCLALKRLVNVRFLRRKKK